MQIVAPFRRAFLAFRGKAFVDATGTPALNSRRAWNRILDWRPGDWQRGLRHSEADALSMPTAFTAQAMIAQDVAKLNLRLMRFDSAAGIYRPASIPAIDDLLLRPNPYQNRLQFVESWMQSKLGGGNAYVLKSRNGSGKIAALHVLDWSRTRPMVSQSGVIFYQLQPDNLSGRHESVLAPSSEVIHDRWNTIYHPLVGVSPLHPACLAASIGLEIQERAARFWQNDARPTGALVVPANVEREEVEMLRDLWQQNYAGANYGKTAVLAGGLDYKPFEHTARDSQLVELLGLTNKELATVYRIPLYKLNAAPAPSYSNTGQLDQEYYSNCLQHHIQSLEEALTLGLELPRGYAIQADIREILRMDPLTKMQVLGEGVQRGIITINEARQEDGRPPVEGGDVPMMQEQNWPLPSLADRNRGLPRGAASAAAAGDDNDAPDDDEDATERALRLFKRGLMQ